MEVVKTWRFIGSKMDINSNIQAWFDANPRYRYVGRSDFRDSHLDPLTVEVLVYYEEEDLDVVKISKDSSKPYTVSFEDNSVEGLSSKIDQYLQQNSVTILQSLPMVSGSKFYTILIVEEKVLKS